MNNKTDAIREDLAREIKSMTPSQLQDYISFLNFGFERIKAGASAETVFAEWDEKEVRAP